MSFKHVRNTYFFIDAIKKACEKYMLLKQHVFLTCQETHVNLICRLYEIIGIPIPIKKLEEYTTFFPKKNHSYCSLFSVKLKIKIK